MHRLNISRNDKLTPVQIAQDVMVTAYSSEKQVVLVAINYTNEDRVLKLDLTGFKVNNEFQSYVTTGEKDVNMKFKKGQKWRDGVKVPGRGLLTVVLEKNGE